MGKSKNKNDLNGLFRLLSVLRNEELIVLKDQLHPKKTSNLPKPLLLLEALIKYPKATEKEIHKKVSPKSSRSAFSILIGVLRKKIHDSLLVDVNISRRGVYPIWYNTCFESNKQLIAAKILFRRGLQEDVEILLDTIIERTKKIEVFEILIEALTFKFVVTGNRGQLVKHLEFEIDYYQTCKKLIDSAWMLHTKITTVEHFNTGEYNVSEIEDKHTQLQSQFALYPSKNLWYWNSVNSIFFLQKKKNYKQADIVLKQVLMKVHTCDAISMSRRVVATLLRLAENSLRLEKLEDCYSYSQQATTLLDKGTYNHCLAIEMSFVAKFHVGDFGKAHNHIRTLTGIDYRKVSKFNLAKWKYYKAATFLFRSNLDGAANLIAQTSALDADKEGWNISIRILEIIIQIESNKPGHIADQKIINLIAFAKNKKISSRNKTIIIILRSLWKTGYNFKEVQNICALEINLLTSNKAKYCWQLTSPELIRFDAWFIAKVKKVEYRYDLALST